MALMTAESSCCGIRPCNLSVMDMAVFSSCFDALW